jgi:zinc protease
MTHFVAAGLIAAAAHGVHAQQKRQSQARVSPFPYETVQLENGFRAYLVEAGAPGQIAFVSIVRTGSRDEVEDGKSGFAHFFEHMMFRGTKKYPLYDEETTKMGAFRNASTWADQTAFYIVANTEYLEQSSRRSSSCATTSARGPRRSAGALAMRSTMPSMGS